MNLWHDSIKFNPVKIMKHPMDLTYWLLRKFFSFVLSIFFREMHARGRHNVPDGPVIFVIAPHHNQFVDPLAVMKTNPRQVRYIIAQKSMKRFFIGFLARLFRTVGVTRSIDLSKPLSGKMTMPDPTGHPRRLFCDRDVTNEIFSSNEIFLACGKSENVVERVDKHLVYLKQAITDEKSIMALSPSLGGVKARVSSTKINYDDFFYRVHEILNNNECVGIFPEGGSHDRPELLPFKSGFARIALGAMCKYPGLNVKIVPVGLSYFHAHRFRSRAAVEYGVPITVPLELVKMYEGTELERRKSCNELMQIVATAVMNVTVTAPDFQTLMVIQAVRRLYRPLNRKLTTVQKLELTRRLIKGYLMYKQDERITKLEKAVFEYNETLSHYGLQDHQVEQTCLFRINALFLLFFRLFLLILMGSVSLPGIIMSLPVFIPAKIISSKKAKEALNSSTVKIEGKDVLATWKLLVAMILAPLVYSFYIFLAFFLCNLYGYPHRLFVCTLITFAIPSISYVALKFGEQSRDIYKSLAPLTFAIRQSDQELSCELRKMRLSLSRQVNAVINELGPTLFPDFAALFLSDLEIPSSQQSAIGLKRVSSMISSWIISEDSCSTFDYSPYFVSPTSPVKCDEDAGIVLKNLRKQKVA